MRRFDTGKEGVWQECFHSVFRSGVSLETFLRRFIQPKRGRPTASDDADSLQKSIAVADVGELSLEQLSPILFPDANSFSFNLDHDLFALGITHMTQHYSRRSFLGMASVAAAAPAITGVSALQAGERPKPSSRYDLESLVGVILDTPRNRFVEVLGQELRRGTSYRQFLAGLFHASARYGGDHEIAMSTRRPA